jgi:tetratricopeptide (TPR) repeat protein
MWEEAVAEYREAIRLKFDGAEVHISLGSALAMTGTLEQAIGEFREAIRLKPDLENAHYSLGLCLEAVGKYEEAIDALRTVVRLNSDDAGAYCNLGSLLAQQCDFSGSLAMYRKGHELGSRHPDWSLPSAVWVAEAERLAALEARWPAVRNGHSALDNQERLFFADLAYHQKHFATAARLWTEAFASDAELLADRRASYAYRAARAAILAAAKGDDDPPPDESAKARFRAQALDLFKDELDAWSDTLDKGPAKDRPLVPLALDPWRAEPDLASVRDADALTQLPEEDQKNWRALWSDVDALLRKSRGKGPTR